MVTNSATGVIHGEMFWVGKTVLLDQSAIQTTRVVTSTAETSNVAGRPQIEVIFTPEGRKRFAEVTRKNLDKQLAILIGGQIVSAPVIKTEISGGKAMISGDFTRTEAVKLSSQINQTLKK